MTQGPRHFWSTRFDRPEYVYGEAPNAFLCSHAAALTPGRALCVADGEGRNGVWLARQGWQVTSIDFAAPAQAKAAALAARHGVSLDLIEADVHDWSYPEGVYDLVVDIFSQFSPPAARARKWSGMLRSLRPGGHAIVLGYRPEQLRYRTGGPTDPNLLYTAQMLRDAFAALDILTLTEFETDLTEGTGHCGRSALIGLVGRRHGAV